MPFRFRFSLGNTIIISLILGILTGIFFGENCRILGPVGSAFVALLQMSVLPYILVAMILGLGRLNYSDAKKLAIKGGTILLFFWVITLVFITIIPVCFPDWKNPGFFSTSVIEPETSIDYLKMYIPSNPFRSLADNVVPAVTLFSICMGVALIGIKNKEILLSNLDILNQSLCRISNFIVKLTPIGTFAIVANAAGSMTIGEFGRIQVYFIIYIAASLLLAIVIIPLAVTTFTPFKYRDIMELSKDALLTAFTTGNLFIILPIITNEVDAMFEKYKFIEPKESTQSHIIIPLIYNFPSSAKLMALLFVLFAGWFSGHQIGLLRMPSLMLTGVLTLFGSSNAAIPFLLNQFHIPSDLFEIYLVSGIVNRKFSTMLSAMFIFCYTLITVVAISGKLRVNVFRLVKYGTLVLLLTGGVLLGAGIGIAKFVSPPDNTLRILGKMKIANPVKMVIHRRPPTGKELAQFKQDRSKSRLEQIKKCGVLRVGYNPRAIPFSFLKPNGELVGYDVEMINRMASDLGCTLEFYPYNYDNIQQWLNRNVIDIAVGGISISGQRLQKMNFSHSCMTIHPALVTLDYQKNAFETWDALSRKKPLVLAIVKGSYYRDIFAKYLPKTRFIEIESQRDYFENRVKADAFLTSAEQGFPWTMLYPDYTVVIPKPVLMRDFTAYPIKKGDPDFLMFVNYWVELQKANGVNKKLYKYWVLGENIAPKPKRWSILSDIFKRSKTSAVL